VDIMKEAESAEESGGSDEAASDRFSSSQGRNDLPTQIRTKESTELLDDGTIKHTVVTKTAVVQDEEPVHYEQARLIETETWHSGEQDTSQVSVSSLPEDEKSEPTSTATVSSTTATHAGDQATAASALVSTSVAEEEPVLMRVEQREWTQEDSSGAVEHVVEQTSTLTTGGKEQFPEHDQQ